MDTTQKVKTMAELLPGLGGIMSKESMQRVALTATKKPRSTMATTRTTEKVLKPLTLAELKSEIKSLNVKSPQPNKQDLASAKKRWNSSAKVECKTASLTANGQMKHNSVRKVLNFQQPKPKATKANAFNSSRMTLLSSMTPQFSKPAMKVTKSSLHAHNSVNISGICNIPETPVVNRPILSRMMLANKENISNQVVNKNLTIASPKSSIRKRVLASRVPDIPFSNQLVHNKKPIATPKSSIRKTVFASRVPDTPLSCESWKSSCDDSFIENEKNVESILSKPKALGESIDDDITEITPPVSTPFANYRNINDFFNNSNNLEHTCVDDTIMTFDKPDARENITREESVIVSLCDMLNRATVSNTNTQTTQLEDLLEMRKQTENNIKMIENGLQSLSNIREAQVKSLECLNKLIQERNNHQTSESEHEKTVIEPAKDYQQLNGSPNRTIVSYKIPSKISCMRKKVFYKSMPNVRSLTPQKDMGGKALSMYMKLKEHNNYLSTPAVNKRVLAVPDTPAITSHNLQKQLDKLYHDL